MAGQSAAVAPATDLGVASRVDLAKVSFASVVGTSIEYFDFIFAGVVSATIWPKLFYPEVSPALGLLFSVGAYALGLVVRPLGAYIFGHFGDKRGRKTVLVWTLVTMGLGSFLLAITPAYAAVGITGGILLFVWRGLQGLGIGGEWGGAAVWITEFSRKSKWRSLWSNWVNLGVPFGLAGSYGLFYFLVSTLSGPDLANWGWRLGFIIGSIIIVLGVVVRYRLAESPLFARIWERHEIERAPANKVLKEQWKKVLTLMFSWTYIISLFYLAVVVSVGYLGGLKFSPLNTIYAVAIAGVVTIFVQTLGAYLGDVIGRRRVIWISATLTALFSFPFMILLNQATFFSVLVAEVVYIPIIMFGYGPVAAFFSEQFETKYRNSGTGISYQLAALPAAGATYLPAYFLVIYGKSAWIYIASMAVIYAVVAIIALFGTKESMATGVSE